MTKVGPCSHGDDDSRVLQSDRWLKVWQLAGIPAFSDMNSFLMRVQFQTEQPPGWRMWGFPKVKGTILGSLK